MRRHSLVWLHTLSLPPTAAEAAAWHQAGHPFIVCRTRAGEDLSLGFCLPAAHANSGHPLRVGVAALRDEMLKIARPPELADVASKLFTGSGILPDASTNFTARLIGSHMWEVLTGDRYTRESSDLDLVLDLTDASAAEDAVHFLEELSARFPSRIDGELSFPGHGEVHWKEWQSGSPLVLVKSLDTVALRPRESLFDETR